MGLPAHAGTWVGMPFILSFLLRSVMGAGAAAFTAANDDELCKCRPCRLTATCGSGGSRGVPGGIFQYPDPLLLGDPLLPAEPLGGAPPSPDHDPPPSDIDGDESAIGYFWLCFWQYTTLVVVC
ncbi:hypothetical protein CYMTET_38152 [Cymbomonas tetramitiformis]|uniref:Secreted protein n=1 Tax=Cymbomonas tetramitiformis TaxID=36881 RepID=A0AAE0CDV8_9CHLO|nr:hypothetical protein CYMTET_38152 [Cymbomonas tetramitiformis]